MENRQNKPPEGGAASGHGGQKSSGFGGTPTSISVARKLQVSIHLPCLPFRASPKMAQHKKNEGLFYLTSVSLAFCSPSAVASMTVNSFSSIVLSSLSICWRQSLSPFCLSG